MAYTGYIAPRPAELHGSLQTFSETTDDGITLRTQMDDGQTIKTRRRATQPIRQGQATVTVKAVDVPLWREWYEVRCQNGTQPTKIRLPPDCAEQIWRFSTPLTYAWITKDACRISFGLEKLPHWVD